MPDTIRKSSSCFVDDAIKSNVGTLLFPCGGGGATATFGNKQFWGRVEDGEVHLCTRTAFTFSDGCRWQSAQEMRGPLSGEALNFSYVERPKEGESGCASACTASAKVRTESVSRR